MQSESNYKGIPALLADRCNPHFKIAFLFMIEVGLYLPDIVIQAGIQNYLVQDCTRLTGRAGILNSLV
ncbi:MAG: hypothetical protein DRJ05_18315 [Bacteroidetes bacterium]|nr:MAG: hypothetical protein DRJ05_18315 [Bacteroidota bacterium]